VTEPVELTLSFLRRHPEAAAEVLEALPSETAAAFLCEVPSRLAAPVMAAMLPFYAGRCLALAGEDFAAGLLAAMPATAAAAVLRRLPLALMEKLLERLPARSAFRLRLLLRYPATTVGAWMDPGVPALPAGITVRDAWERLRREAEALDRFLYVVDREQRLQGRVAGAELLRADNDMLIDRLAVAAPAVLSARSDLNTVLEQPAWRDCDPLPVLSRDRRFLGVARYAVLRHAETTAFAGRPASAFGDTLMELMETYWTGLSRLVEGPFSLLPPARPNSGKE
jgi:Mg/Co/Ni transporter MgtE